MFCGKCGKEVKKGAKFCPNCGEKAVEEKVKEVKKEEKKVEAVKVEPKVEAKKESSGLGIAGMVIGIVSLLLSWLLTLIIIIVPVVGLILSCCAKGKKGFKITGIVTNALAIVACIVLFIVYMATLGSIFGTILDENADEIKNGVKTIEKTTKAYTPVGTWTCVDYYSDSAKTYADDVTKAPAADKTVLYMYADNTYKYGPYSESYKNYYKGTYTYEIELDKNETYRSQGAKFLDVKASITDAMIDGVKQYDKTQMNYEMELLESGNYDTALIMFYSSYNTYYCQR